MSCAAMIHLTYTRGNTVMTAYKQPHGVLCLPILSCGWEMSVCISLNQSCAQRTFCSLVCFGLDDLQISVALLLRIRRVRSPTGREPK